MSVPEDPRRPHVERTPFTPKEPPKELMLYFCPACGAWIDGSYNLEPARKRCTKTWHMTDPVGYLYCRAEAT